MQNLGKIDIERFNCLVADEIHNYGTDRLLPFLQRDYKYKMGLSATVKRGDDAHYKILEAFNYSHFVYSPKQALDEDILNPFNFINISVELDGESRDKYEKITKEINTIIQMGGGFHKIMRGTGGLKYRLYAKLNERKDLVNNYPRKFEIVKRICEEHSKDKIIIFNEYNKTSNKLYWYLLEVSDLKCCIIHSGIEKKKRDENLLAFEKDKYNVVLTSKVLDEGYNLPKLDVAIISAGNSTSRQTIQRMGRVLRKKDKKSILYQIYCANTIEEEYSKTRAVLFKSLCSDYRQFDYINSDFEK